MKNRNLSYSEAINEATFQIMRKQKETILIGQLVDYETGVFGTTTDLVKKFGKDRVRDFPVAESLMTNVALGLTIAKKRVILVHHRLDFMLYSMDSIVNWISLWRFKSNGKSNVPIVIRAIVGKGWGQGPQHSKSLHSWFSHLPGLNVIMPTNPFDAKGLLLESIVGNNPVVMIEHRSLFNNRSYVPKEMYKVEIGKGRVIKTGKDITLIAIGYVISECIEAAKLLIKNNIYVEIIDPRTISPLDIKLFLKSIKKTKKLIVVDAGWETFGAASEIISKVTELSWNVLNSKPIKITFPDSHTPMSKSLEDEYYPNTKTIVNAIKNIFKK
ncbi:hypothetical protein OAZ15_05495 [Pelagibacteraceae bacterium]|nr:hypothetical protein [Pelagibacteraceae bacterium]